MHQAFIVDHDSETLLVAAGTSTLGDYYDTSSGSAVAATSSQNDVINFVSTKIMESRSVWPTNLTMVALVNGTDVKTYSSLSPGDGYFVQSVYFSSNRLSWDIVVVEKVDCAAGQYVDISTLKCITCVTPMYSTGGATTKCDACTTHYYLSYDGTSCEECPDGATCDGSTIITNLQLDKGYWRISRKTNVLHTCTWGHEACVGGGNFSNSGASYCADGYKVLRSSTEFRLLRTYTQPTQLFAAGAQLAAHTQPVLRTSFMAPAWRLLHVSRRVNS